MIDLFSQEGLTPDIVGDKVIGSLFITIKKGKANVEQVNVIIRSYKAGAGNSRPPLPAQEEMAYQSRLIELIRSIHSHPKVDSVFVIINTDPRSTFSEIPLDNGSTFTSRLLKEAFTHDRVFPLHVSTWGKNPGSGVPMNPVIERSQAKGKRYVLVVSKEIIFQAEMLDQALELATFHNLLALGFYRQQWWMSYQWMVPQNTCCLWNVHEKYYFEGFDSRCDGSEEMIRVGDDDVLVAGMEDFYHLLKVLQQHPHDLRWGMMGMRSPFVWDLSGKNETEMRRHWLKVQRQQRVMQHYAKELFPDESWEGVLSRFFASCRICR